MKIITSAFAKYLVVIILVACAISYFVARKARLPHRVTDGYDFNSPEDANASWIGPPIGEQIDLNQLKDRAGGSLSTTNGDRLSMLVLVDPECGACRVASDEMRIVRDTVVNARIQYCLVSVTSSVPSVDFFKYTDSLDLDAQAYLWATKEGSPSEKLYSMVLPSHLLVDGTGHIIRKWPGTSTSQSIRFRMAKQIATDALAEISRDR